MQFGQFLAHDITLSPEGELECCNDTVLQLDKKTTHPSIRRCFNIDVKNDQSFPSETCFPFTRSDIFCPQEGDPREQINGVTAFIDGSSIYGSDEETSIGLRDTVAGIPAARLKTQKDGEKRESLPSRSKCGFSSPQSP